MKRVIPFFLCFLCILSTYTESFPFGKKYYYPTEWGNLVINEKNIVKNDESSESTILFGKYLIILETEKEKYIVLNCDFDKLSFLTIVKQISNLKNWEINYSKDTNPLLSTSPKLQGFKVVNAENYITETKKDGSKIEYIPGSYFTLNENPWAVKIDSERKEISLNTDIYRVQGFEYYPVNYIVIVNGFVCAAKDYLYEQNSRAKRIRISYDDVSFVTELQDTGNFQYIKLPKTINPKKNITLDLEVLDAYPGTKYSDVVISGVYYVDAQM